jgi:predicted kinase
LHDRVGARRGDASDAGTAYVEEQAKWDVGAIGWPMIDANRTREEVLQEALDILRPMIAPAKARNPAPTRKPA